MSIIKLKEINDLIDDVNAYVSNPPENCNAISPIDHVQPGIVKKSHFRNIQDAISSYAGANDNCPNIAWEEIKDIIRHSTIDEIRTNLGLLSQCDCSCCHRDQEGHGGLEFLSTGAIDNQDSDYVAGPGEVNWASVVAGHAFTPPFQGTGGTPVSSLFSPEPGAATSDFFLTVEVHRISDDTWHGATIGANCTCGECTSTGIAEIPTSVFSNFPGGFPPDDFDNYRVFWAHSNTDDLCDDCGEHPKPFCEGEGG